jgi:hypothetical protein
LAGYLRARVGPSGILKKNQQGEITASISIAKGVKFRATARLFLRHKDCFRLVQSVKTHSWF